MNTDKTIIMQTVLNNINKLSGEKFIKDSMNNTLDLNTAMILNEAIKEQIKILDTIIAQNTPHVEKVEIVNNPLAKIGGGSKKKTAKKAPVKKTTAPKPKAKPWSLF